MRERLTPRGCSGSRGSIAHSLPRLLLLASLLLCAASASPLLPAVGDLVARIFGVVVGGGCSHEDVGVLFLQLAEHFLTVLRLRETAREQLY